MEVSCVNTAGYSHGTPESCRAFAGVQPSEKGRAMAGQYSYDGWSCVRRMENNEPPLMQCYSNPKKARLTAEVCHCS